MDSISKLISAFDRYCEVTGLAHATASTKAANDGKFYDSIKAGKDCTTKRCDKVLRWLQENTPKKPKNKPTN